MKNIIKSVCFLSGLVIIFFVMSHVFERKDGTFVYDGAAVQVKEAEVRCEDKDTLDVIYLGDSICYSGINPLQIYAEYGYTSYVCGTSAQRLCDSYAILKSVLENQKPKAVVIEPNCLYRDIRGKKEIEDKMISRLAKYFSIFENHSRWKDAFGKVFGKNNGLYAKTRGFVARNTVKAYKAGAYMKQSEEQRAMDKEVLDYLSRIYELCKEKDISLVFVSIPSPKNWNYEKHNGVQMWAKRHGIEYKDLNLEDNIAIDWEKDTKDGGDHLNLSGATKVSHYLGNWMQSMYQFADKRNNPRYENWMQDAIAIRAIGDGE